MGDSPHTTAARNRAKTQKNGAFFDIRIFSKLVLDSSINTKSGPVIAFPTSHQSRDPRNSKPQEHKKTLTGFESWKGLKRRETRKSE
ncbi:hypothetical protein FCM35_KLT03514 [Carex littledalei]|uniref:Uncharacterized protein n=1 Tax=Carex littledalei TaxID=544730 RepID=A0A833RB20_9POAL|nr:hypothetical protein FCM35_KLT03514 [Carex littledalei]